MRYQVVETFVSINGEGVKAGQLAVFIRFHGCNLSCAYCDTRWANEKDASYTLMTKEEIYTYVKGTGIKNVTLTGGEPLKQPGIGELISLLCRDGNLAVEIETNGSIPLEVFGEITPRPAFTMDYKLAASGMEPHMYLHNFQLLQKGDTVKFVVGSREDLDRAQEIVKTYCLTERCQVYLSPVFGKIAPSDIVEFMKEHHMNNVTMQLQMHKIIWDPDKRGV